MPAFDVRHNLRHPADFAASGNRKGFQEPVGWCRTATEPMTRSLVVSRERISQTVRRPDSRRSLERSVLPTS